MKGTFFKFYDIYTKKNVRYFSEEFLKSNSFEDIIYPKFRELGMRFAVLSANIQLLSDIVNNIKKSPQVYNTYSQQDKKKVRDFLKQFQQLTNDTNVLLLDFVSVSLLLKEWE